MASIESAYRFYLLRLIFRHRNVGGIWFYPRHNKQIETNIIGALEIVKSQNLSEFIRRSINGVIFIPASKYKYDDCFYIIYRRCKVMIVSSYYAEDVSLPYLASLLVKWANMMAYRLSYDSVEARKSQVDFLTDVNTEEAFHIINDLEEQWRE